ncbi:MAG: ABC transporter ATP-binding protein [Firmicutes bacterium]|nr:ABC transporter ATP-binding protein [Bacillota bacterium]
MLIVDWKLALGIIALGAIRIWINSLFVKPLERASNAVQSALGKLTERLSDIANGGHVIRMFNLQRSMAVKFAEQNEQVVHHGLTRVKYAAVVNSFNIFNGDLSFLGLIIIGGWMVMQGWYTLGTIALFVQLQNGVEGLFRAFGQYITQLQTSLAGGRRALEIINQQPEPHRIQLPTVARDISAAVALESVTFAYPGSNQPALNDISLTAAPGELIALVGPSGGGKSTLFKLLLGFYPPESGAISVLGKPLDSYTLGELRDLTALVPQSAHLFSGTVAENIGFGKPGASREEIEAAAQVGNAHEFICQLPDGYETIIGERGSRLSGGQRQRIAIARAVLRDAPILLLDEATSSLDTESEELVQQALKKLMKGRTTFVIAHRLSTVRNADKILVIDDGRVSEQGNHQELMEADGLYKRLHDMQFAEDFEAAG